MRVNWTMLDKDMAERTGLRNRGEFLEKGVCGLAVLAVGLILFWTPFTADAKSYEAQKRVGEYETEIRMDRNPPVLGDNHIEIEIREAGGKRITDAKVWVNYYMPPMPRMAPMNFKTDAKLKGERYKATLNFIMSGPWIIAVKINLAGKILTAKFNVEAQ